MKPFEKVCRSLLLYFGCWWCREDTVIARPPDGVLSPSQMERNLQVSLRRRMCFRCVAQIWWKHPQILENKQSNQGELFLLETLPSHFNNIKKIDLDRSILFPIPNVLLVFSSSRFPVTSTLFELSAIMSWFHTEPYDHNWKLELNYFSALSFSAIPNYFSQICRKKIDKIKESQKFCGDHK